MSFSKWYKRRQLLSIFALNVPFSIVVKYIPGLKWNRFTDARKHALCSGIEKKVEMISRPIERYNRDRVGHFINHLLSPNLNLDLPFGVKELKLDCGERIEVANMVRSLQANDIVTEYLSFCNKKPVVPVKAVPIRPLGRATLFKILHACKASYRKSLQGIDSYTAAADDAILMLKEIVDKIVVKTAQNGWNKAIKKYVKFHKIKFSRFQSNVA